MFEGNSIILSLNSNDMSCSNRDFTNGCLVAEILSWYYPQDVQLHSISNGTSVQARLANWQLIDKARDLDKFC